MDTILLPRPMIEKTATGAAGIGIAICLLITQNLVISAKDTELASLSGMSPSLQYIIDNQTQQEKEFNSQISQKYAGATIVEVEKGIKHAKMIKFYNNKPVRINVIELSQGVNERILVEPATASDTLASKSKISNIAHKHNAIAAINGGYFKPQTGVPLGTLMINKKVYTGPIYDRVAMGIFDNGYSMARVQLKASIDTNLGGLKIDNVNQPRMLSTHTIVYTREWGEVTPPTPKYGAQMVVENGKLIGVYPNSVQIPENGFVLVAPIKKIETITGARKFALNINLNPEWKDVNHIISGGPYLVRAGEVYVDTAAQKLSSIGGRNPRTAIGYTKDNHLIMLTADGREGSSIGLTLTELAELMKEFGCINAMNLDGGGSTVMYVQGHVVNKPAIQGGIPLSHTLTVSLKNS